MEQAQPEPRPIWTDAQDEVIGKDGRIYIDNHATIWRWRDAFQKDFAARMDWCVKPYGATNHLPVTKVTGPKEIQVKIGERITLDASDSSDPDDDQSQYKWIHYPEPGQYWHWQGLIMEHSDSSILTLQVPAQVKSSKPQTTHLILEVTDNGTPSLTRYQRIIVNIE